MENNGKKVVLFNPNPLSKFRKSVQAPVALISISALLDKEDYDIKIVSGCLYDDPEKRILEECDSALCLGITCMTGYQIKDGLSVAKKVKAEFPEIQIIWGGWHPSMEPEETIKHPFVDVVVRGQGERTFSELVHALNDGSDLSTVSGITYKKDGKIYANPDRPFEDINNFPNPPYHLIDVEKCIYSTEYGKRTINYISSTGCPYRCSFCENQAVYKRRWSGLDTVRIVDDIEWLVKNYNVDSIAFHDSNFFVDKKRVKKFCKELIRRELNITWGNVNGRTRQLLSYPDELWELMKKSGLRSFLVGAESGYQEMLDFINKDNKVRDTIEFAKRCEKFNIKVIYSLFIGLPWDSNYDATSRQIQKEYRYTLDLIEKLFTIHRNPTPRIILSHYTPYPGSPLYLLSLKNGFVPPNNLEGWSNYLLEKISTPWMPKNISKKVGMLTTYIFFFLDSDSYHWTTDRVKNKFLRMIFKANFRIFEKIAAFRWKYKFFSIPLDYKIYMFARNHGAILGFYQS